jgi:hypothetical protein
MVHDDFSLRLGWACCSGSECTPLCASNAAKHRCTCQRSEPRDRHKRPSPLLACPKSPTVQPGGTARLTSIGQRFHRHPSLSLKEYDR